MCCALIVLFRGNCIYSVICIELIQDNYTSPATENVILNIQHLTWKQTSFNNTSNSIKTLLGRFIRTRIFFTGVYNPKPSRRVQDRSDVLVQTIQRCYSIETNFHSIRSFLMPFQSLRMLTSSFIKSKSFW